MELGENIRCIVEDAIIDGLYEIYPEDTVDKFLKHYGDEMVTTEMVVLMEQLTEIVTERIEEIEELMSDEKETDEY